MMKKRTLFLVISIMLLNSACGPRAAIPQAAGKHVAVGEHDLYYEVHGSAGAPLVLIHGWTGDLQVWRHQLNAFPEHRVVAVDLPGNGRSSRVEQEVYSMEFYAESVHRVLEAEGIEQAFFFGHSMGFAVVEVIAARYPEQCLGIGAIDGAHFEAPADSAGDEVWLAEMEAFAGMMTDEEGREQFINMLFLPDTPESLKEEILRSSRTVPLSIGRAMIKGVAADLEYWRPKQLQMPVLAVYSPAYGLPEEYPEMFAVDFPQVEYHTVERVSHFFMLEIPKQLNEIIAGFVGDHWESDGSGYR